MSTRGAYADLRGWFKSSRSRETSSCVEVRFDGDTVLIRDSKYLGDPANVPALQPMIAVPLGQWKAWLDVVVGRSTEPAEPSIAVDAAGSVLRATDGTTLTYTPAEWDAFTAGILDGEFDRVANPV